MYPIIDKAVLSPNLTPLVVTPPRIALVRQPGQFVIVGQGAGGEAGVDLLDARRVEARAELDQAVEDLRG